MPVINEDTELEVAAKLTLLNGPTIANDQNDENLLPPTTVSKMIAETVEGGIAGDAVSEEKEDFQTGGGKSTSETTEEESQIVKKEVESDTGTEEIEREAVTEEQAESQKTGEGTPATEIVEEVAKTGTEETASETVTEEKEETETGGGKSTSKTTIEEPQIVKKEVEPDTETGAAESRDTTDRFEKSKEFAQILSATETDDISKYGPPPSGIRGRIGDSALDVQHQTTVEEDAETGTEAAESRDTTDRFEKSKEFAQILSPTKTYDISKYGPPPSGIRGRIGDSALDVQHQTTVEEDAETGTEAAESRDTTDRFEKSKEFAQILSPTKTYDISKYGPPPSGIRGRIGDSALDVQHQTTVEEDAETGTEAAESRDTTDRFEKSKEFAQILSPTKTYDISKYGPPPSGIRGRIGDSALDVQHQTTVEEDAETGTEAAESRDTTDRFEKSKEFAQILSPTKTYDISKYGPPPSGIRGRIGDSALDVQHQTTVEEDAETGTEAAESRDTTDRFEKSKEFAQILSPTKTYDISKYGPPPSGIRGRIGDSALEAEIQAANKKISKEVNKPTVKIKVLNKAAFGTKPQEADIEFDKFQTDSDLKFEFISAKPVDKDGESEIRYSVSSVVTGSAAQETSKTVGGFQTKSEAKLENLKKQYKNYFGKVFASKKNVLSLGKKTVSEGTVYGLTFANIAAEPADKNGHIVLSCALWKSQANGMFTKMTAENWRGHFSIDLNDADQLVLYMKNIDATEGLSSLFAEGAYQVKKTNDGVTFKLLQGEKDLRAFIVPQRRQVKKEDLKNKKFLLKELTYTDNSRYLEIKDDKFFWRFGYSEASEWFSVISPAICSESAYIAEQYQEMEWKLTNNDGNKEQIKVSSKGGSLIMVGSNGCWTGWKEKALLLTSPSSCWIKRNEQFELKADISWSATEQGQLVLKLSEYKPKRWGDKNSFWFMKVNQRLDEWDGKSDLSQSVIDEVHLVPPRKD